MCHTELFPVYDDIYICHGHISNFGYRLINCTANQFLTVYIVIVYCSWLTSSILSMTYIYVIRTWGTENFSFQKVIFMIITLRDVCNYIYQHKKPSRRLLYDLYICHPYTGSDKLVKIC